MKISLIVAVSRNGVIGSSEDGIPWQMPRDQQHFRSYTQGKWMLLGRKTYDEMQGWFTDQTPVVVTSRAIAPGVNAVATVEQGIELARSSDADEIVISGGAAIYELSLPYVKTLIITRIDTEVEGDRFFVDPHPDRWHLESEQSWPADEENPFAMNLQILTHISPLSN